MELTDEGRLVLEASRRIGADVQALRERLAALAGDVAGVVRVSSLVHLARHLVEPAIARLLADHPGVRVELTLDDGPLHFSRDGLDLAVRVGLAAESTIRARKLLYNDVALVAAPALLARAGAVATPDDLLHVPKVAYRAGPLRVTSWRYLAGGEVRSVEVDPVLFVNDGDALLRAALAGVGVAYVSAFAARSALADGSLVRVLPDVSLPPYDPVSALYSGAEHRPRRVQALLDRLFAVAAAQPDGAIG